ncbi:MAG: hypothetical protein ACYC5Y_01760 [Symbiobacteriia bacterium]
MTSKNVAEVHSPDLPSASPRQRELILFSGALVLKLTRGMFWVNALLAAVATVLSEDHVRSLLVSLLLLAGQLLWGKILSRGPERNQRQLLLYLAYVHAVCSLGLLATSLAFVPGEKLTVLTLYLLGLVAAGFLASRLVSVEKDTLSGKPRKWYMLDGSGSTGALGGAAVAAVAVVQLIRSFGSVQLAHIAFASAGLIAAVALGYVCCYNLEKYRRYPEVVRRAQARAREEQET